WTSAAGSVSSRARWASAEGLEDEAELVVHAGRDGVAVLGADLVEVVAHRLGGQLGVDDAGGDADEHAADLAAGHRVDLAAHLALLVGEVGDHRGDELGRAEERRGGIEGRARDARRAAE